MSVPGTTRARPPPVAPPFMPKTGPSDGSRSATTAFSPRRLRASAKPMAVVVFPSPAFVGVTAVTMINRPRGSPGGSFRQRTLAFHEP